MTGPERGEGAGHHQAKFEGQGGASHRERSEQREVTP